MHARQLQMAQPELKVRVECKPTGIALDGPREIGEDALQPGAIEVRLRKVGFELYGFVIAGEGRSPLLELLLQHPAVVVSLGEPGVAGYCALVTREGLVRLFELFEQVAAIQVSLGVSRSNREGITDA